MTKPKTVKKQATKKTPVKKQQLAKYSKQQTY